MHTYITSIGGTRETRNAQILLLSDLKYSDQGKYRRTTKGRKKKRENKGEKKGGGKKINVSEFSIRNTVESWRKRYQEVRVLKYLKKKKRRGGTKGGGKGKHWKERKKKKKTERRKSLY